MKLFGAFKGGIHPPESKDLTKNSPIERMPLPSRVVIPLQQHIGAVCEPLVNVGDEVQEGQKIGAANTLISAPVHASISGKVVAIEPHPHPVANRLVRSIIIENAQAAAPRIWDKNVAWDALSTKELLDRIKEAGIVGMGGAAFPTHVKLSPPKGATLDALIINGVECEPYLTVDHRLMVEQTQEMLEGVRIIRQIVGVTRIYIGIEENKPDAIQLMRQATADASRWNGAAVTVVPLRVKYPQGAEKQLIKAVTGKEAPSGGLPFDVGVVVQNAGTAFAIYEAVVKEKPLIERFVTVTGNRIASPKNLAVRIGTPFSRVIEYAGGIAASGASLKIIMGGPMMGMAQYSQDVPVIKGTSGILALEDRGPKKDRPCVKCGMCVDVCPMGLTPNRFATLAERDDFAACDAHHVRDCIECGACAYICPSNRPIVHFVKYAKLNLIQSKKS